MYSSKVAVLVVDDLTTAEQLALAAVLPVPFGILNFT
jgi:hypothetical protein